jgi:hypothetical protein
MQRSRFESTQFGWFEEKSTRKTIICESGGKMKRIPGVYFPRGEKRRVALGKQKLIHDKLGKMQGIGSNQMTSNG